MRWSDWWHAALALALGLLGIQLARDPGWRAGLVWAVRSWFVPPDFDAGWEQHVDRHPAARPSGATAPGRRLGHPEPTPHLPERSER